MSEGKRRAHTSFDGLQLDNPFVLHLFNLVQPKMNPFSISPPYRFINEILFCLTFLFVQPPPSFISKAQNVNNIRSNYAGPLPTPGNKPKRKLFNNAHPTTVIVCPLYNYFFYFKETISHRETPRPALLGPLYFVLFNLCKWNADENEMALSCLAIQTEQDYL